MKQMIKLVAVLLLSALTLCSCATVDGSIPDGMMIASCAGADYRLYVPTTWTLNTSYGVSGAYRNLNSRSTVSMVRYEAEGKVNDALGTESDRLSAFFYAFIQPTVREQALDQTSTEIVDGNYATVLGGENAHHFYTTAIVGGETLHFTHVIAERKGGFYVLSFVANDSMFELLASDVEKIISEFVFGEPYQPNADAKIIVEDANAPAGMKPAYSEDVAYRFYVPESWVIDLDHAIYAAYEPTDKTSISVIPYYPDSESMSVTEYYTLAREQMIATSGTDGFCEIRAIPATLGGRNATDYEFTYRIGSTVFHYRQIISVYKSMLYCLTYTATESAYDAHLTEFEQVVSAFSFR